MRPPPLVETLPPGTCSPPVELYKTFSTRPGCVFLDSALTSTTARYSILACEPSLVVRGDGEQLNRLRTELATRACAPVRGLPFVGGAIGYFSYDYGSALEGVSTRSPSSLPALAFGFYDTVVLHDHITGQTHLVASDPAGLDRLRHLVKAPSPPPPSFSAGALAADLTLEAYANAIQRIRNYIAAGDVYQVNFTQRFSTSFSGDAASLHLRLRTLSPAPHTAFLDFGDHQIVSSSPERLLRVAGRTLETRPIKGTVARLADPHEDADQRARLLASAKDHAELLMIVDLARNDLGRVCVPGSVLVTARHDLETYATVHHLVATVRGELAPGLDRFDALRALHPGGSITGAPKIRAMQIIAELEPAPRQVYTGALGYLSYDGDADFAIAIRTITCSGGRAYYHVGGGITWDSAALSEYEETEHKGRAMRAALTAT